MSVFLLMFVASELARSTQGRAGRELCLEAPRKMLGNDRHRVAPGLRLGLRVVVCIRVDVVGERGRVAIHNELDTSDVDAVGAQEGFVLPYQGAGEALNDCELRLLRVLSGAHGAGG